MAESAESIASVESVERIRLQFQGAQIERANLNGKELEIVFSSIPQVLVKDPFGFDFDPQDECKCTITITNPNYDYLPKAGPVNDGHIALGELCYISLFPPDLNLDCPCFLMVEQPLDPDAVISDEDVDVETETFMIVGDHLTVTLS